ncbi:MAG: archease [Thermodesulfobacteriota bacterium]
MAGAGWEHFHHVADIGVRGHGATVEEAFVQAALALTAVIADPETISPTISVSVQCEAPEPDLLLVDWLNAIIYEMAVRSMLFSRFAVTISGQRLTGRAWGERVEVARHRPAVEVKGATYTALRVAEEDGRWLAQCVVDV